MRRKTNDGRLSNFPFSQKTADQICALIMNGARLTRICGSNGIPSYNVICRWRRENEEFSNAIVDAYYARHDEIETELWRKRYFRRGKYVRRTFRRLVHQSARQIGVRYPEKLKPKIDKRRSRYLIDTGISILNMYGGVLDRKKPHG